MGAVPRIKICGIQDVETAVLAAQAGADAIGLVFAPSRRRVTTEAARAISLALPPFVSRVGVFVDAPLAEVKELVAYCRLDVVQLHGREEADYCRQLPARVIKSVSIPDGDPYSGPGSTLQEYYDLPVAGILFDTAVAGQSGGTGRTFDWTVLGAVNLPVPVILAGGLNPENVRGALEIVRPYGVDVSSGVETGGVKDNVKIYKFIQAVKGVA